MVEQEDQSQATQTTIGDLKMATFIEQAKEVLQQDQMNRLELLARKSADFDSSPEEDTELMELKREVKKLIANRDRDQNLKFIKDGGYSVEDVLGAMGIDSTYFLKNMTFANALKAFSMDKKVMTKALKDHFDALSPKVPMTFPLAIYGQDDVYFDKRQETKVSKAIKDGGVKLFVENLSDSGKAWLMENHVAEKGPYGGKTIYANVAKIVQKYKFDKKELMIALGIEKEEKKEKPKAETTVKKAEKAHATA